MSEAPNINERIEAATADCFWLPDEVSIVERPEIIYTHSRRPNAIFNRVLKVRPQLAEPKQLVDEVHQAHADTASRWYVNSLGDSNRLQAALADAGYQKGARHLSCAIGVHDYSRDVPDDVDVQSVETADGLRTLYRIQREIFGGAHSTSEQALKRDLAHCTGDNRRVIRFVAYRNGEPAGCGGLTAFDELQLGLIWAGGVIEDQRGHGVYTALLAARAQHAASRGLKWLGLYARENTSAPIVVAHGFEQHGYMVFFNRSQP